MYSIKKNLALIDYKRKRKINHILADNWMAQFLTKTESYEEFCYDCDEIVDLLNFMECRDNRYDTTHGYSTYLRRDGYFWEQQVSITYHLKNYRGKIRR